jgi:D-glycero-alpha-D-manno-heptose 1-phosphate guanylyltransferase
LDYVLDWLIGFGIERVFLSLHYRPETFFNYLRERSVVVDVIPVVEPTSMGTGGAVKYALDTIDITEPFCVVNGDTYLEFNLRKMFQVFNDLDSRAMIGLSYVADVCRFGKVIFHDNKALAFEEKSGKEEGWVNNGCYIFYGSVFSSYHGKFSIEKDMFPQLVMQKRLHVYMTDGDFLDIGIPEDYYKFQEKMINLHRLEVLRGD